VRVQQSTRRTPRRLCSTIKSRDTKRDTAGSPDTQERNARVNASAPAPPPLGQPEGESPETSHGAGGAPHRGRALFPTSAPRPAAAAAAALAPRSLRYLVLARSLPVHGVATAVDAFVASWSLIALDGRPWPSNRSRFWVPCDCQAKPCMKNFLNFVSPFCYRFLERPLSSVPAKGSIPESCFIFFLNLFSTGR
jgi:hypothetical protein